MVTGDSQLSWVDKLWYLMIFMVMIINENSLNIKIVLDIEIILRRRKEKDRKTNERESETKNPETCPACTTVALELHTRATFSPNGKPFIDTAHHLSQGLSPRWPSFGARNMRIETKPAPSPPSRGRGLQHFNHVCNKVYEELTAWRDPQPRRWRKAPDSILGRWSTETRGWSGC